VAITISNLSNKKGNNAYTFSDLHLDLAESKRSLNTRNAQVANGPDILADHDEQAIKNEIINLFTQIRYTNPQFGINLRQYIGQPLSDFGARSLGEDIDRVMNLFLTRARVKKILVAPDYNTDSYVIALILELPNFNKNVMLNGKLDDRGKFEFVN
jgi:hypothetical protein